MVVIAPVHVDYQRDQKYSYGIKDNTKNECRYIELLGIVRVPLGLGIIVLELKFLRAISKVERQAAQQRAAAAEYAQPRSGIAAEAAAVKLFQLAEGRLAAAESTGADGGRRRVYGRVVI